MAINSSLAGQSTITPRPTGESRRLKSIARLMAGGRCQEFRSTQPNGIIRHPPDDRPSDPSLPPDDGICKSEPCLEYRHAPTAGNIGTPREGSPEIAFIKRHLSYGSCWN